MLFVSVPVSLERFNLNWRVQVRQTMFYKNTANDLDMNRPKPISVDTGVC